MKSISNGLLGKPGMLVDESQLEGIRSKASANRRLYVLGDNDVR